MASLLEALLDSIDPTRTLEACAERIDNAFNSFTYPSNGISEWRQFRRCLVAFWRHAEAHGLDLARAQGADDEFYWGYCLQALQKNYGEDGAKAAFEMTRAGAEGGLYRVLNDMASWFAEHYAQNEVRARVHHFWNELSADQKRSATGEYIERFRRFLPPELTEGGAGRIHANLPKILEQHPALMAKLRRIGELR